MELWEEIKKLKNQTLKTLNQGKLFDVIDVTNIGVVVMPHDTGQVRFISRHKLENSYRDLVMTGSISRSEIEKKYSPRHSAYIIAILAKMPGIRYSTNPTKLFCIEI